MDAVAVTAVGVDVAVRGARTRVASLLSELCAPWVCAAVLPVLVGALTDGSWRRGALFGVGTALLTAVVPYLLVIGGVRRGRLSDRHVSRRQDRPVLLGVAALVVSVALGVMHALGAPAQLLTLILAMVASATIGMVVSVWWKLSLHALVITGSCAVLVVLFGPWALASGVLVVAVGWSRVQLGCHTGAQVVAGAAVGALIAGSLTALT